MFEDSGETNVTTNRIKVPALVPGTMYQFRVSAISQSGRGAEVILNGQTQDDQGTYPSTMIITTVDLILFCSEFGLFPTTYGTCQKLF